MFSTSASKWRPVVKPLYEIKYTINSIHIIRNEKGVHYTVAEGSNFVSVLLQLAKYEQSLKQNN